MLSKKEQFKVNDKKNPNEKFTEADWNRNMTRILEAMSNAHATKVAEIRNYYKSVETAHSEISKLEGSYQNDIKASFK